MHHVFIHQIRTGETFPLEMHKKDRKTKVKHNKQTHQAKNTNNNKISEKFNSQNASQKEKNAPIKRINAVKSIKPDDGWLNRLKANERKENKNNVT